MSLKRLAWKIEDDASMSTLDQARRFVQELAEFSGLELLPEYEADA